MTACLKAAAAKVTDGFGDGRSVVADIAGIECASLLLDKSRIVDTD